MKKHYIILYYIILRTVSCLAARLASREWGGRYRGVVTPPGSQAASRDTDNDALSICPPVIGHTRTAILRWISFSGKLLASLRGRHATFSLVLLQKPAAKARSTSEPHHKITAGATKAIGLPLENHGIPGGRPCVSYRKATRIPIWRTYDYYWKAMGFPLTGHRIRFGNP